MKRRSVIAGLGSIGLCGARGPIERSGNANLRLGLAAYSLREHFTWMKGKPKKGREPAIDMFGFLNVCAKWQVPGAELTSYFFPPNADQAYFRKIRHHAHTSGVTVSGTAIGNNFSKGRGEHLGQEIATAKRWIDRAVCMGAPHVRFFAGTSKDFAQAPERLKIAIEALQECTDYAGKRGIFVGVENHGNLTSKQVLEIVNGVESKWFGVNLDTGNFHSKDPYADLEKCAPYAVNIQLKTMMKDDKGKVFPADLERITDIFKKARYQGFVVLEYEENQALQNIPRVLTKLQDLM